MIYCPKHNAAYAAIQKTGSLSMRHWLLDHYGGERIMGKETEKYHRWELPKYLSGKDVFVFTVVRHPIKSMESLWNYRAVRRGEDESFEDMCQHYINLGQTQVNICDQRIKPAMWLKVEALAVDVTRLPFFDASKPLPQHLRKTQKVKPDLTNQQMRLVRKLFADDFKRFDYD